MSRLVRVAAVHPFLNVDKAFDIIRDFRRHALMSDAVRKVTIEEQPGGTTISHWEVYFRRGILIWSEFDEFDFEARTLRFRRRDGDPEAFEGEWTVRERPSGEGCEITFEAEFDIGMPTMREMLEPIAARTMQENIAQTMRGVFGDAVEIALAQEDTTASC
jgi:ribosome-associated toxin RatA of RatAB toxin-antitoxin module